MERDHEQVLRSATLYERSDLGRGAVAWVYEYWNAGTIAKVGTGAGLEIGVQLRGEWLHKGETHGALLCRPGMIHRIDPGERYRLAFESSSGRGVQVGFIVYPREVGGLCDSDVELRFADDSGVTDPVFYEACRAFRAESPPSRDEIRRELLAFVARHCEPVPLDRLRLARREIEDTLGADMNIAYFAEVAGMHPETFARAFRRQFGVTPATYRVQARLNQAARLVWSRPEWSLVRVAEASGFFDMPYFHRAFRRYFGCTPNAWARGRPSILSTTGHSAGVVKG